MSDKFIEALNECLERLKRGESIQDCLRDNPTYAEELRPLLEVAISTMRAAESAAPDPAAKARNFERFSQAAAVHAIRKPSPWRLRLRGLKFIARPVAIGAMCLALLVTGVGATTAASSEAVPGEALYWVKTTRENVESRMARSDESRANYEAKMAQVRGDEIQKLIERGHFTEANIAMGRMNSHLKKCARYAGISVTSNPVEMPFKPPAYVGREQANKLGNRLENDRRVFVVRVESVIWALPPEKQGEAERMLRQTNLGYALLIDTIVTDSPVKRPFVIVAAHRRD